MGNNKFKAIYQEYDWCYEMFINRGMSMQEMAVEAGCTLRVIQKWCSEKYKLNALTFKNEKHLNDLQRQIIMFGILGDGHIDKRENQPLYIESHADNQKDYIYWKYNILKDLCAIEPIYKCGHKKEINGKICNIKASYRLETRIINDLKEIRSMSNIEIISQINKLGLCLLLLDDGNRADSNWELCVADWTDDDIEYFISICFERFNIKISKTKDKRYILFKSMSTHLIDQWMLDIFPNDLDIIKYKIINNVKKKNPAFYLYVLTDNGAISLSRYAKNICNNKYNFIRQYLISIHEDEIKESDLLAMLNN